MSATPCTNQRCEFGWVQVLASYVDRHAPEPELPELAGPEYDEIRLRLVAEWKQRQASLRETWYPCKECNHRLFMRWAGGHLQPDHDRDECEQCQTPSSRRGRRREHTNSLAIPVPQHQPDDDDQEPF